MRKSEVLISIFFLFDMLINLPLVIDALYTVQYMEFNTSE